MSGHTAEKWWIDDDGFIASGRGDDYKTLAQIIDTGSNGENNANAALIAAAPELYEACRELLLASEMPYGSSEYPDAVDKARAAIAKAEGRLEP